MSEGLVKSADGAAEGAEAFVSSLVAAVERPASEPDPGVSVAFALGWQMAELYEPGAWPTGRPKRGTDLPGFGALGAAERALVGLDQVDVALSRLKTAITEHGLAEPTTEGARKALAGARPTDGSFGEAIFDLHLELLGTLTAASFKLGKAYGLGRALADTTRQPKDLDGMKKELERHRIATLRAWLADLSSAFPAHTGHAVDASLGLWRDWAAEERPRMNDGEDPRHATRLLRRQGERWRALLSGEKQAEDMLELHDYVSAGSAALGQLGSLTWSFLRRFWALVVVALALFALGIWVILADSNAGHVAAGLGGIVASLGLTWKGVGGSLGTTAGKLERPVWDAALDREIACAMTLVPGSARVKGFTAPIPAGNIDGARSADASAAPVSSKAVAPQGATG